MSLFTRKSITVEIGGKPIQVFPLSIGDLYKMKTILAPIAKVVGSVFGSKKTNDNSTMVEKSVDPSTGQPIETAHISATDITLAKFRAERMDKQVTELVEAVFSEENKLVLGRILTNAIYTQWDHRLSDPEVVAFMDALDVPALGELLQAFAKANVGVFGPLGQKLTTAVSAKVKAFASGQEGSADVEQNEPVETPSEQTE